MIHLLVYSSPYPDKRGLRNEKLRDQTTTHRRVHWNLILILLNFSLKPKKTQQLSCKQIPVVCPHHPLFLHPVHFHLMNLSAYVCEALLFSFTQSSHVINCNNSEGPGCLALAISLLGHIHELYWPLLVISSHCNFKKQTWPQSRYQ